MYKKIYSPVVILNYLKNKTYKGLPFELWDRYLWLYEPVTELLSKTISEKSFDNISLYANKNPFAKQLPNVFIYYLLAALPLLGSLMLLVDSSIGILLLLLSIVANIIIYYLQKGKLQLEFISIHEIVSAARQLAETFERTRNWKDERYAKEDA